MNEPEPGMKTHLHLNRQQTLPLVTAYLGTQRDPEQGIELLLENQKHLHHPVRYLSCHCHDQSIGHHLLVDPTLDQQLNHLGSTTRFRGGFIAGAGATTATSTGPAEQTLRTLLIQW